MSPLYQAPVVSDTTFIEVGWALLSRQGYHRRMSIRRYKAHFGIVPGVCADIWAMINPREEISPYAKPVHLLWGLMLMKVYSTEEVLSGIAGVTEKTYRKWAWTFIRATSDLSYSVIRLEHRFNDDVGNIIKLSVDGTDCRINKPRKGGFDTGWYSHKFNGPGVRYEVGLNIRTGDICWINGPFKAGTCTDPKIFEEGLNLELAEGELVHADKAYRHLRRCSTPYDQAFRYERQQSSVVRARHETVNKRLKDFKALSTAFRHPLSKHGDVFRAAGVCVQLSIGRGSPLFHIDYRELLFLHNCVNSGNLSVIFRALRSHPWLVPDRFADADGVVWRQGGEARVVGRSG
ncbi:hypothetical protein ACHAXT_004825 [Thalassiosira profunda]